ncbi:hypothetical protein AALP_AA8G189600 [Arabis alpina]|uniref:Uncharacterized protein n=1 Tax=Arabis alpina TaxID=50452 RepID=A0A087G7Z6_ARAAL|nr:hypothetical protein AALP_AA8G189600 [Arabis alpina]
MFSGGSTKAVRMIKEAKEKNVKGKQKKIVGNVEIGGESSSRDGTAISVTELCNMIEMMGDKLLLAIKRFEEKVDDISGKVADVYEEIGKSKTEVIDGIVGGVDQYCYHKGDGQKSRWKSNVNEDGARRVPPPACGGTHTQNKVGSGGYVSR